MPSVSTFRSLGVTRWQVHLVILTQFCDTKQMEPTQIPVAQPTIEPTTPVIPQAVPPTNTPVQQKPNNFPIIILSFLLFVALFGIAYLYTQIQSLKNQPLAQTPISQATTSPTSTPVSTTTPATTSTPEDTTTWKTYNNDLFGFNFKYPVEYSLNDQLQQSTNPSAWTTKNSIVLESSSNGCSMWFMVNPDGFGPFFPNKNLTSKYNSDKGFMITKETSNSENLTPNIYNIMLMGEISTKTTSGFIASGTCPDSTSNRSYLDKTFTQILSTFKFTN